MSNPYRFHIKRAFLAGTTPLIEFTIKGDDGVGFQPDTLTMSIYDYDPSVDPPTETIINSRNDVDIIDDCDADGNVSFHLQAEDTDYTVPEIEKAIQPLRRLLFRWTWGGSPELVGMGEIILTIQPNRETLAT